MSIKWERDPSPAWRGVVRILTLLLFPFVLSAVGVILIKIIPGADGWWAVGAFAFFVGASLLLWVLVNMFEANADVETRDSS